MTRTTSTNFTGGNSFTKADAVADPFLRSDIQQLATAVDGHDHTTGKGLAVSGGGGSTKYEVVLASAQASVTLPVSGSLPSTSRNIRLTGKARCDNAAPQTINLQFNGDTAANYDVQSLRGAGATASASVAMGSSSTGISTLPGTGAPAGAASAFDVRIPDYAGTIFWKHLVADSLRQDSTSSGGLILDNWAGTWRSTAAITTVRLAPSAGNFIAGSVFTLYLES